MALVRDPLGECLITWDSKGAILEYT
jgi:hypothetical protein